MMPTGYLFIKIVAGSVFQDKFAMMPNRSTDILFQLIKSLEKAEKRHFKLYIKRSSGNEDLKIVRLFDALDKLKEYDEKLLLKKLPGVTKPQLANLKIHLYKQVLASLRLLKSGDSLDLQLNEQFDYAHILYKKGLFHQSLRILERAKEIAKTNQKFNFLPQIISLEKRIENLHITRSMQDRAELLSAEANEVSRHINMVARLSNLALKLYSWYVQHGHARNEEDEKDVRQFMKDNLATGDKEQTGFYERLYLFQSYTWYAFIRQDFLQYYRYSQKWADLFTEQPLMIRVETGHYIKGLHNLLNAHFDLRNYRKFEKTLKQFEKVAQTGRVKDHDNFRIQAFIYISTARINQHFMLGTFKQGLSLIPGIEEKLEGYHLFIDSHRILVLNYKIAMLYFGSGDYATCIDYLQKIINDNTNLRYDLQCYARVLHLMAHYELGNDVLMESLSKSVYRFMAKMKNLTVVEEAMFKFLRQSIALSPRELKPEMEKFLFDVKHLEKNRFETRAFAYLDIISWVESKVYNKPMGTVIHEKYLQNKRRK
jgi:tetratricopeptide (TPR) repeat protein